MTLAGRRCRAAPSTALHALSAAPPLCTSRSCACAAATLRTSALASPSASARSTPANSSARSTRHAAPRATSGGTSSFFVRRYCSASVGVAA